MERRKHQKNVRNLYLPGWIRLRMSDDIKKQSDWLISQAESCNAGSVKIKLHLKNRPWNVTLSVERRYNDYKK